MASEPQILRGTRSSSDVDSWFCETCSTTNMPEQYHLFDLPPFTCTGFIPCAESNEIEVPCDAKHFGDFSISFADIQMNDTSLPGDLSNVKQQLRDDCIANAVAASIEIRERVTLVLEGRRCGKIQRADAAVLDYRCRQKSEADGVSYGSHGMQDIVGTALLATTQGVRYESGQGYYKMPSVAVVDRLDFEKICKSLANGNPLVCTFLAGKKLKDLEYCQLYKPPSASKFKSKGKPMKGHAVVIVGAGRHLLVEYLFFLNSWGELFCSRVDVNGQLRKGGVGKIRASDLLFNVLFFPRTDDTAGQTYLIPQDTMLLSAENKKAMMPCNQVEQKDLDDVQIGLNVNFGWSSSLLSPDSPAANTRGKKCTKNEAKRKRWDNQSSYTVTSPKATAPEAADSPAANTRSKKLLKL